MFDDVIKALEEFRKGKLPENITSELASQIEKYGDELQSEIDDLQEELNHLEDLERALR